MTDRTQASIRAIEREIKKKERWLEQQDEAIALARELLAKRAAEEAARGGGQKRKR